MSRALTRIISSALFVLFIGLPPLAIAQTEVSGSIDTPTTWTIAGSPYLLAGDTTVRPGVVLTIEAGVRVEFGENDCCLIN